MTAIPLSRGKLTNLYRNFFGRLAEYVTLSAKQSEANAVSKPKRENPLKQDRPGQGVLQNSWGDIVLRAIPYDRWIKTMDLYCQIDNDRLGFKVCQQSLLSLSKRGLITRKREKRGFEYQHKRLDLSV